MGSSTAEMTYYVASKMLSSTYLLTYSQSAPHKAVKGARHNSDMHSTEHAYL